MTREHSTPRRGAEEQRRAPEPQVDPAARVLALQRSAGNAAVAQLLRKDKQGDPPRAGGWNETTREVAGTKRVPVEGITAGNQEADVKSQSAEGAAGKAVVV